MEDKKPLLDGLNKNSVLIFLGCVLIAVCLIINQCNRSKYNNKEAVNLVNALNDSLVTMRLKDSSQKATISVLQTDKVKTFLDLQIKDQGIKDLQDLVKQYKKQLDVGSSVTKVLIETLDSINSKTVVTKIDTVKGADNTVQLWPTYTAAYSDKWINYDVASSRDSTHLNIKVINEYDAIIGYDHKKAFVDVISHSPYSSVKSVRTYQVSQPPPKRFGIGVTFAYGVGESFKFSPFIGVGINYNIIRF